MIFQYEQSRSTLTAYSNQAGSGYPARFHKDVEMICVVEGSMEMQIDGVPYRLDAGAVCAIFPNIPHCIIRQKCKKHLIMVSPALIPELSPLLCQNKPLCPVLQPEQVPQFVPLLFQRCIQLHAAQSGQQILLSHVRSILREILHQTSLQPRNAEPELILRIVDFILAHYAEDLSLEQLSQAIGYSKFHVSRCLNDTFGCNFRSLVNNYRISAAEEMLLHSHKSVTDIAYACGFPNQSTFNRAFLKYCGMTPTQYRKKNFSIV